MITAHEHGDRVSDRPMLERFCAGAGSSSTECVFVVTRRD